MSSEIWNVHVCLDGVESTGIRLRDGLVLGRHPDCDIVLEDRRVSARHAKILVGNEGFEIQDLGSVNGIRVDDIALRHGQTAGLRDETRLQIGYVDLVVRKLPVAEPEPSAEASAALAPDERPTVWGEEPSPVSVRGAADLPARADSRSTSGSIVPPPSSSAAVARSSGASAPPSPAVPADGLPTIPPLDRAALNTIVGQGLGGLESRSKLERMGARLVLLNEADLRVLPIRTVEFTIGRDAGCEGRLEHRGASGRHARIVFSAAHNLFLVEDLGSANGTQFQGAPLAPHEPRALHSDVPLRFGTVDAVFLQDVDSELLDLPGTRHDDAVRLLKARGKLSARALQRAREEAAESSRPWVEALLLGQHVGARDWGRAVEDARMAQALRELSGNRRRWFGFAVAVAVAGLVTILLLLFR